MSTDISFRIDDFPLTKPEESWRHNLENFKIFDSVMKKHGVKYILGVIPRHVTREQLDYLASQEHIEVALHGILHDERFPNEFREFETIEQIYSKIMSAKEPLKRCNGNNEVTKYIPPHNVIDDKTCQALKRAGLDSVYGGPGSDTSVLERAYRRYGLKSYFSKFPTWYGRSDEMLKRKSHEQIIVEKEIPYQSHVITLHWTWEWNIGINNLDEFLFKFVPSLGEKS